MFSLHFVIVLSFFSCEIKLLYIVALLLRHLTGAMTDFVQKNGLVFV